MDWLTLRAATAWLTFLCLIPATPVRPQAARADVSAEEVRRAIDRAVGYLRREEKGRGHWGDTAYYPGGVSALCTLALLEAGVPTDDPLVQRALNNLRSVDTPKVYVQSLQLMVFCRAGQVTDRPRIRGKVRWLESVQVTEGRGRGGWGYPGETRADPSNSQFALLGLHEAEKAGFEVQQRTWQAALGYWHRGQSANGSWRYPGRSDSGSMTCAGVASLIITLGSQGDGGATVEDSVCQCGEGGDDERIEKGLRWLGDHFSVTSNPGDDNFHFYYLYGLERVGRLTAQRFLYRYDVKNDTTIKYDWYREGADYLVKRQNPDGYWEADFSQVPEIATSFGLLFLSKGRRPVLISELKRPGSDWNRLRYDLTNLTRHVETKWKLPLTWQVIDVERATADDYVQTPVLYISGEQDFTLTDLQRRELRRYVEQGGFIFADAACGGDAFGQAFAREMREVFPEPGYELKPLDPQHPIWSIEERIDPVYVDPDGRWLWGIDFACKTSVVYCPGNLGCYWALDTPRDAKAYSKEIRDEIDACRAIGVNVLAYATNRKLKPKDAIPRKLAASETQESTRRGHFAIAKLRHAGGCDAAPRAMANLMDAVSYALDIRTIERPLLVSLVDNALFDYHFVYMHGRNDFILSDPERDQLRKFVERGGTVMADALCASSAFAKAFRREMNATFGEPLERVSTDHPIFTPAFGGADLEKVTRRESIRLRPGGPLEIKQREGPVELEAITVDDRLAVIFSPLDLSCALEKHVSPNCRGYTPEDAARIAINVILYSLQQ